MHIPNFLTVDTGEDLNIRKQLAPFVSVTTSCSIDLFVKQLLWLLSSEDEWCRIQCDPSVVFVFAEGNNGVQCLLCGNRFASVKNMIKHQEKAHADEVRQHKERARAGELSGRGSVPVCVCVD